MTAWRRRLRHTRLWLQALFAAVVIALALGAGLVQIALPWIVSHPHRISAFLSSRLQRTVTIERVEGHWESDGPLLILHGVDIAASTPGQPASVIPKAELKINFLAALRRNQSWNEFRLIGLNLQLVRNAGGDWQLRGLGAGGADGKPADTGVLFDLGSLVLSNLHVNIDDADADRHLTLTADEVRLINSGSEHRVLARVHFAQNAAAPVAVVINYDSAERSGEMYIGGSGLDLGVMLHADALAGLRIEQGGGRLQLWSWWQHGHLQRARAEADLQGVVLSTAAPIKLDGKREIAPRVAFDHVAFGARWQREQNGWQADVADLVLARQGNQPIAANVHVEKSLGAAGTAPTWTGHAENLDIAAPASVAILADALPETWRRWLYLADPVGTLHAATLRYAGAQDFDVDARFGNVAWHAVDKLPGVGGISGTLRGDQGAFVLSLPAHTEFALNLPRVFRRPLEFSEFSGDIAAYRVAAPPPDAAAGTVKPNNALPDAVEPGPIGAGPTAALVAESDRPGWRVETDAINFQGVDYGGQLRGAVELHDDLSRPVLDVAAVVTHAQLTASHLYWPSVMPPDAVAWLDRALSAGQITARAVLRGDLADWPFRNFAGRFEARVAIDDGRVDYLPDWPAAEHLHATATFVNTSLHVDADAAQALHAHIDKIAADIPDLGDGVLDLDAASTAAGKDLLGFVKATPIGQRFAARLLGVSVGGKAKVGLHLHLPIKQTEQLELVGTAALTDADLADTQYALLLKKANGTLQFSQKGFRANDLTVTMNGKPATFSMAAGGFVSEPQHGFEARLRADLPVGDLLAYAPILAPYANRISGSSTWDIGFSADNDTVKDASQRLTVASDLRGVAITLPAPLAKAADAALPLNLTLGLPFGGGSIDVQIADLLHMHGRLASPQQPFAAQVDFGATHTASLPASGFSIAGSAPVLDLSGWMDFASSASTGSSSDMLAGVNLQVQSLRAYARDFGAAQFKLAPAKDGLNLDFDGANLAGNLFIPTQELHQRGVTAQFARLYWPESPEGETSALAGENPAAVPPLHIRIGDFRLGHGRFGQTALESYPVADGTHFEQVSTHSANVQMRAHGDWTGAPGSDRSTFSIDLSAHNLGRMLDAFGYAGVVEGGTTVAHITGSWAGSPSTFSLTHLDGTLKVSVQEGRIPEASPGAGRIFGLFNLGALPRRLTLDFGDLFKSGLSFDSIEALFHLKDGNAVTNNLTVKGPTADITVSGRTGLKARDYDQIMQVTPHVGGTLAVGGALVGGPVGAAAGVLLQGIFKNQLNEATRTRYHVTGSWEKPEFTIIAKEPVAPVKPSREPKDKTSGAPPAGN